MQKKMNSNSLLTGSGRLLAAFTILLVTGFSCSSNDEPAQEVPRHAPVSVATAELETTTHADRYSGTIASNRTVNLSTKVMGRLTRLNVEEGDSVEKGAVLIRIKDDNLQAQKNQVQARLQEAKSGLDNTETNYRRMKALYEQESATKKELDDIRTQYEVSRAKVRGLKGKLGEINDMLEYTVLEAPFSGYVVAKIISEGDMASPGQPLLTLEQKGRMKVEITVPETQVGQFNIGDSVSVDIQAAGLQDIGGTVAHINPAANRGSRQYRVEIQLPNLDEEGALKSGMFAQVGLSSPGRAMVTVPSSAIIERGQLSGIYTLTDDSEVMLRWIRLGDARGDKVEVLSGLAPGERYVSTPDGSLHEGQKVSTQQ